MLLAGLVAMTALTARGDEVPAALAQAETLLRAGQPEPAFALLAPLELEEAGSPYFDYLYGIAALDTGRRAEAIVALERVLAREPDFQGARLELARARFENGDLDEARAQFEFLLTESPPPEARTVIGRYLAALDSATTPVSGRFRPYAEVAAGWDSNANASTSSDTFLGFPLNSTNVETDSVFFELAGGFQHALPASSSSGLLTAARLSHRFNPDADFVDQTLVSLGSAWQKVWGPTRATIGASGYYGWLDGSRHAWSGGADLGLARRFGIGWEGAITGRVAALRYAESDLGDLDVNRYIGSLGLTRSGLGSRNGRVGVALLYGQDDEQAAGSAYGNERLGARVFAGWQLGPGATAWFESGYLNTDFDDAPGFFGTDRDDDQWTASFTTLYQGWPLKGYSLAPTIRYTRTDSNVALYDYDRLELGVFLRWSPR